MIIHFCSFSESNIFKSGIQETINNHLKKKENRMQKLYIGNDDNQMPPSPPPRKKYIKL